jgi:transcriptional regulator with XRE-family HTH domain
MTPAQFKDARKALGLSLADMAKAMRLKSTRAVRYYESGERTVSGPMQELVRRLLADKETGK